MKIEAKARVWGYRVCQLILGAVFIYAAIFKIGSPQDFADSIATYQILPAPLINLLALGLPVFELVCGLFVLTGFYIRIGVLGILTMLTIFSGALALALLRGLSIHCGCFGAQTWLDSNPWAALFRDSILFGLAIIIYRGSLARITAN